MMTLVLWVAMLTVQTVPGAGRTAQALELCGAQSKVLMRSVGITQEQIDRLCRKAALSEALLSLDLVRSINELGYCRVTLALTNNSTEYLNVMVVTSHEGTFESFRFHNILPGGTGYASANSNILLDCEELETLKVKLIWPPSLRIGDRAVTGATLRHYRPVMRNPLLAWNR